MIYQDLIEKYPHLFKNQDAPLKIITDPDIITRWQEEFAQMSPLKSRFKDEGKIGVLFEDSHYIFLRDLICFPDGTLKGIMRIINRGELSIGSGVVVLPVLDHHIILIEHFRSGTRQWHLELPRGFGEHGISPEMQARAEIEEEIGGKITELTQIGYLYNNTGLEGNKVHLFFARLSKIDLPNQNEGIRKIVFRTKEELEALIHDGGITDGFTLSTYAVARIKRFF